MAAQSRTHLADRVISILAARQHGVVARRQLLQAGVTRSQIAVRLASGRLHEIHRGVYLVGHSVAPAHAREQAALLACGPHAVLSHRSAAALWKLVPHPAAEPVVITVPPGRNSGRPRIKMHRANLSRRDIRHRHRLRLTSPPRTILDLAAESDLGELELLVAEAAYRRLASERELQAQIERNPRKRGGPKLARVLDLAGGPQRTRSPAERRVLRLLREAGIDGFQLNQKIHGYEVDVLWRDHDFALEIDGYEGHSSRVAFERDRLKIATLKAHGLDVMPVTPNQARDDPGGVLERIVAALRRRGYRGGGSDALGRGGGSGVDGQGG